jgi:PAS domain S-box-containing protein
MDYRNSNSDPSERVRAIPDVELIYRMAPIGLAFLSTDCRYVMINDRMTEICGISAGDHIGRSVHEMVPQLAEQVEHIVQTIQHTGESIVGIELNGQRSDGSNGNRVWITYWHPFKNQSGNIVGINVAAEEITERKRTEVELVASRERLVNLNRTLAERVAAGAQERDRLWNLSQDLLVVSDSSSGVILNVNPAWSSLLGWDRDDLIGKSGEWLVHADDRERSAAEHASLVAGQKTQHFESRLMCKDGSHRWLSWFAVLDGGLIYATGRDITDRRKSQDELRALHRQLADASHRTTINTMTASIAHEIKQPLAAMLTNASASLRWLKRSDPNLSEACAALDRIVNNGYRANEVIAGIRAMFGKESGEPSLIDIRLIVHEILNVAQGELETNQILVSDNMTSGLPRVIAVRVQLQQVILNLIMNAVEAMRSVTERERRLTIASSLDQQGSVMITVEDTGNGIDPVHLPRIFEPFFTTKSHGMGLGLSICRSIIEAHGGRLWASPRSHSGAVFHLSLPSGETEDRSDVG